MPNIRMLHICYFVSAVIIYHKYVFCEYINTERQKKCMSKEKEPSPLGRELETYQTEGIPLWLNGKPSTPEEIVHACMIELICGIMCRMKGGKWNGLNLI